MLAVDIGGTKINAAVVDAEGLPDASLRLQGPVRHCPTPAQDGPRAVVDAAIALGREAVRTAGISTVDAVGIASAGIVDVQRGAITHATDSLPGWPGTRLAEPVAAAFAAPCSVLNDVHAHGLGEALCGVGRGRSSLLMVAVGTGIGGALISGGEVVTGAHGAAGHIGHMPCPEAEGILCSCGRSGHLEGLASGPGIAAAYARRSSAEPVMVTTRRIAERAAEGEDLASEVLRTAGFATGRMIGGLLNTLDPEAVAVTGGVTGTGPPWWQALHEGVRHDAMDAVVSTEIREATAGNHAALLGAAHRALRASS